MTGVLVSSYGVQNENQDLVIEPFQPVPLEGHEVVLFGPENIPIQDWVSRAGGRVPANMDELKSVIGCQYKWLQETAENYGVDFKVGDCGGEILCTTINKDRVINQKYLGNMDECLRLAQRMPGKIQSSQIADPSQKVGRNAPCPCGSGKKYKKCCGGRS